MFESYSGWKCELLYHPLKQAPVSAAKQEKKKKSLFLGSPALKALRATLLYGKPKCDEMTGARKCPTNKTACL